MFSQYGLDVWILFPLGAGIFVFTTTFKLAVGATELPFIGHHVPLQGRERLT
jgi:hypothetical protein